MKLLVLTIIYCISFFQYTSVNAADVSISQDSILLIDYYPNGKKKLECYYYETRDAHGKILYAAVGKQIRYYSSGIVKGCLYYKNGIPHGKCEEYNEQGILEKVFYYIDGKLNGPYIYYYPDGKVMRSGTFKDDHDYGPSVRYFTNGNIFMEESYNEQGIQEGEVKIYNEKGELIKKEMMYNGKKKKS